MAQIQQIHKHYKLGYDENMIKIWITFDSTMIGFWKSYAPTTQNIPVFSMMAGSIQVWPNKYIVNNTKYQHVYQINDMLKQFTPRHINIYTVPIVTPFCMINIQGSYRYYVTTAQAASRCWRQLYRRRPRFQRPSVLPFTMRQQLVARQSWNKPVWMPSGPRGVHKWFVDEHSFEHV